MTREEIENIPKNVNTLLGLSVTMHTRQKLDEKLNEVCDLAIKALEQEPKTDILNRIVSEIEACRETEEPNLCDYRYHRNEGLEMAISIIDKYRQEPKTGHWAETRYRSYDPKSCETYDDGIGFRCSNCANVFKVTSLARYHYCPNCGCRMESEG